MLLKRIRLRGLTRFTSELDLDLTGLPPGIVAVVGGNGEGKTTIMEAIAAALYRELPSRGGALKDWTSGRDAFVEVELGYGGTDYRLLLQVDRDFNGGRGKEEGFIFANGAPLTAGRVTDYDEKVAELFPSRALFLASAFAAQNRAGNFLELPVPKRKELFSTLLGNEHLQELARRAGDHRKPLDAAAARLDQDAERLAVEATTRRAREDERAGLQAELPAFEVVAAQAAVRLDQATGALAAASATLEAAARARVAALARQQALQLEIGDLEWAITRRSAELLGIEQTVGQEQARRGSATALAQAMEARGQATNDWRAANTDLKRRTFALEDTATRRRELEAEIERLQAALVQAQADRMEVPQLEARVRDLGIARTDHQQGSEELRAQVARHQGEWAAYRTARSGADQELQTMRLNLAAAERQAALVGEVPCGGEVLVAARFGLAAKADERDCGTCRFLTDATAAAAALPSLREGLVQAEATVLNLVAVYAGLQEQDAELEQQAQALEQVAAQVAALAPAELRLTQVRATLQAAQETETSLGRAVAAQARAEADQVVQRQQYETAAAEVDRLVKVGTDAEAAVKRLAGADLALAELERALVAAPLVREAQHAARARAQAARDEAAALVVPPEPQAARQAEADARQARALALAVHGEALQVVQERTQEIARLEGAIRQLGDVAGRQAALSARRTRIATRRAGWVLLEQALGRDGIQAREIDQAGPEVSRLTNELLDGCYGSRFQVALVTLQEAERGRVQKEVFDIAVHDGLRGGVRGHNGLSGGEKVLVDEALKLALAIFNARRHGAAFETLWRDECDGALSDENAQRYPEMLRTACRLGGFRNLLFVTHRPDVSAQADALIHVQDGRAWVEVL